MIVAVDPGQNVGLAVRFDNSNWGTLTIPKVPEADERFDLLLTTLVEQFDRGPCEMLVLESFKTMSRYLSKYGLETIELVGAIRAVCWLRGIEVTLQMPTQRKPWENTAAAMIKARKRPSTDHEVSALSHLLAYEYRISGGGAKPVQQKILVAESSDDGR